MTPEQHIEEVLAVIEREMGPIGLIARVEITNAVEAAIYGEENYQPPFWDDDDDDPPAEPEPDPPPPPKPDLYELLGLRPLQHA